MERKNKKRELEASQAGNTVVERAPAELAEWLQESSTKDVEMWREKMLERETQKQQKLIYEFGSIVWFF